MTDPSIRATAFAVNILVIHLLGDVPAPPLLGAVGGRFGWDASFEIVVAAMALAGVIWMYGARYLGDDTDRVERSFEKI